MEDTKMEKAHASITQLEMRLTHMQADDDQHRHAVRRQTADYNAKLL
jgi:hypothetical protein